MYSCQIKKYVLVWVMLTIWLCGSVLWYNLQDEIATKFWEIYKLDLSDEYLSLPYEPLYSKDPFLDAMSIYTWMSAQTKIAWVKYVEKVLSLNGCSLSKEKQWSILYYFLPEFRWEIARTLKIDGSDYASNNYTFDEEIIMNYCTEFYNCITYKPGVDTTDETQKITSGTPENVKTNCKEFFQTNYREGQAEEKRIQNLQISWLWNDRYLNATTEESSYDVMTDLGVIWELSYLQVQKPITPIFYDLPVFAKSKASLTDNKNWWWNGYVEESYGGIATVINEISLEWGDKPLERENRIVMDEWVSLGWSATIWGNDASLDWEVSLWWNNRTLETIWWDRQNAVLWDINNPEKLGLYNGAQILWERTENNIENWSQVSNGSIRPLSPRKTLIIDWYDNLIEWLWAYKLNEDKSAYYWSLCKDEEDVAEPESIQEEQVVITRDAVVWTEVFTQTKVEYQELVDYMLDAVTSYTSLSEEKAEEIERKAWDLNRYDWATTAEQTEAVAKKILNCYQSCVWLSVDGQLSCMLKCSCGEIKSPIFDPDVNPGMWPIFMIRFCAVPAVNPRYFYGWSDGTDWWTSTLWWWKSNWGWGNTWWSIGGWWSNWWWVSWWEIYWDWGNPKANEEIWTSFNVGWTKMVSMEKWTNEILWVVDKLAREWRLWIWTPQYNFLDSSTKMMDIRDTASFTMSADKKSLGQKVWEPTDEYMKRYMKNKDDNWLLVNHVANPLDNPSTRNYYRLISQWEVNGWDVSASVNANATKQSQWYLDVAPWFIVDQTENSNMVRYAEISELFGDWLDEQWDFWARKVDYLKQMDEYAQSLYAKKW